MPNKRIPELDGIRGLAALSVMIAHYFGEVPHGLRVLTVAWLGVDVFFVLSGFLIGSIILEEHGDPNFFKSFYLKRGARIVPVYAAVCVFSLLAATLTAGHLWSDNPFSPGIYSVFGANVVMSLHNLDGGLWLRPTWTLDVEEQFYLLLPLLICIAPRKLLMPMLLALWVSATALRLALNPSHPIAALVLLPCRMDFLLSGVVLALLHRSCDLTRYLTLLRTLPLLALLLLFGVRYTLGADAFTVVGGAIASVGIAAFLASTVCGAPEGRRYRSPALSYFGQISYCLYLVHQPVSGLLHGLLLGSTPDVSSGPAIIVSLVSVAASIGVAAASWKWLEQPILIRARHFRFGAPHVAT